jgi:pyrroloquinoline-quinone synthase
MDLLRFENIKLLPAAERYRAFLDEATQDYGWDIAAAIVTIFVEGSAEERAALAGNAPAPAPLEKHPLVRFYGLPVDKLALTKAHRQVEGQHRQDAWNAILTYVAPLRRGAVVRTMKDALDLWLKYRDEVAEACELKRADLTKRTRSRKPLTDRVSPVALR